MAFHGEVSDAVFEEARRRYGMPEAESLDEISEAQAEKRRLPWARELELISKPAFTGETGEFAGEAPRRRTKRIGKYGESEPPAGARTRPV